MEKLILSFLAFGIFSLTNVFSQYTFTANIQGQTGIDVDVTITFNQVVVNSSNCDYGFNYQIKYDYDVSYNQYGNGNGNNDLNTLQGRLACGSNQSFFNLPTGGGIGTSQTANNWTSQTNCNSIKVQDLMCDEIDLTFQGPGIGYQTIRLKAISSLPVEFIDFEVESTKNNNILNWSTASEKNNDYFTVERSMDGENWVVIQTLSGAGTTSEKSEYTIRDENFHELTYYRLKQFDFDGTETELKIISAKSVYTEEITAYPNPAENTIYVKGADAKNFRIVDAKGADQTKAATINNVGGKLQVDISNLNRGVYFLFANYQQLKIIKQ